MKNVDVEEFVQKIINDDLIRTIELNFINVDMEKFFKDFKGTPDDYDQKQDYGIYTGDSENARNHLLNTLNIVYQKGRGRKVVSEYERTVQRDLRNWFKCIDIFEYHEEVPEIFCIMVRLGYGEIVCDQVKAEYQSFKDSKEYLPIDDLWIPDALRQIRDIGVQLFQKEKSGSKLYCQVCAEFIAMLDQIRFLFKSADYKHEQEVRLLYVYPQIDEMFLHTDGAWPKLYVQPDFPIRIKEIIMGPKCKKTYKFMPYLQEQIAKMFERNMDFELPRITMSGIQY